MHQACLRGETEGRSETAPAERGMVFAPQPLKTYVRQHQEVSIIQERGGKTLCNG
jgi:hypothetical protein